MPRKTAKRPSSRFSVGKKSFTHLSRFLSPLAFLVTGIIFLGLALFFQAHSQSKYSFASYTSIQEIASESASPTFIKIDKIEVSLPIKPTVIIDGDWQIREDAISHLSVSSIPGGKGNIIMYGHNTDTFFKRLPELSSKDIISVITKDGKNHLYEVEKTLIVSPDDIWVLEDRGKEELTLYTCYGFADLKRFVVKARPLLDNASLTDF